MKNSLLLELFLALDTKERRDASAYLRSAYHNQRTDVVRLFDYLSEHAERKDGSALEKEMVHHFVFPGEEFNDKNLRYAMSFLYKHLKDWLAWQEFRTDPFQAQTMLVSALRKRGAAKVFEKELQQAFMAIEKQPLRQEEFHLHRSKLFSEQCHLDAARSRSEMAGFREWLDEWTYHFMEGRLKQAIATINQQVMTGADFQLDFLPEILALVETKKEDLPPGLATYLYCYRALTDENSLLYFEQLRYMLGQFGHHFVKEELLDLYKVALNYCIRKVNNGEVQFKVQAFKLYQEGLKQDIFLENGYLSRFSYKNIVATGLSLREFAWAEDFIETHREAIEPKYRHSAYHFNLALLHYMKGDYDAAMTHLLEVGTDDVPNNLNARRMLLRIYYDKKEFAALDSHLDAFRTYLYRRRGLGYLKDLYLNLIKFTRRLLNLHPKDKKELAALRNDIQKTKLVAEKEWLLGLVNV